MVHFTPFLTILFVVNSFVSNQVGASYVFELSLSSLASQSLLSRVPRNTESEPNSLYDSNADPLPDLNYSTDEFEKKNPKLEHLDVDVFDPQAVSSFGSKENVDRERSPKEAISLSGEITSEVSKNVTLVNFCCEPGEVYDIPSMQCTPGNATPVLEFHDRTGVPLTDVSYIPVVGIMNCSFFRLSMKIDEYLDQFIVTPEGELVVGELTGPTDTPPYNVPRDGFCLLFPEPETMEAFVCFPELKPGESYDEDNFKRDVYPSCLIVSSVFMLLTLLVYCLVKELHADQLSISFMCSIGMLATAHISMVISMWNFGNIPRNTVCVALASLSHFCFLSAFLWLNVICITVLNSLWRSGSPSSTKTCGSQFYWKCLYSFGLAAFIAGIALIRHTVPAFYGSALPAPHFGSMSCWFAKSSAMAVYLFGPISILLAINLVCFCLASYRICTLVKRSHRNNTHFVQYLKLFLLMGVSWIFEVISFFVDGSGNAFLFYTWIFFDFVNIMQGVLIFVVFVCRPSVLRSVITILCGANCASRCFSPQEEKDRDETEIAPCNTVV